MLHRRAGTPSARRPPPWRRRRPAPRGCARRQNPTPLFVPLHNTAGTYGNVPLTMEYVSGHLQRKSTMPQDQAQDQSNAAQAAKPADEPAPSMTAPAARPVGTAAVPTIISEYTSPGDVAGGGVFADDGRNGSGADRPRGRCRHAGCRFIRRLGGLGRVRLILCLILWHRGFPLQMS